MPNFFYNIVLD